MHGDRTEHMFGSFENEELENEDRSTKHPNLENETFKTRKRSTLDQKRSTQNSKTKTPTRKRSTLDWKRSTQKVETGLSFINTRPMLIQQESSTITNRIILFPTIESGPSLLP